MRAFSRVFQWPKYFVRLSSGSEMMAAPEPAASSLSRRTVSTLTACGTHLTAPLGRQSYHRAPDGRPGHSRDVSSVTIPVHKV
jgi:hypothetical protein